MSHDPRLSSPPHAAADAHTPSPDNAADAFDARLRAAHAEAVDRVSARVQAQLHQRRRAALAGGRAARPWWPALAVAGTAAVALAVGLQLRGGPDSEAPTAPLATLPTETAPQAPVAAVDSNPPPVPAAETAAVEQLLADAIAGEGDNAEDRDAAPSQRVADAGVRDAVADADVDPALLDSALADTDNALFAAMDETPDFYAWLESDEGRAALSEVL